IAEAIDRIQRFFNFLTAFILRLFHRNKQILKDVNDNQLSSTAKISTNNLTLPELCQSEELNTSILLTNDSLIEHDNIEMQPIDD
ncbi:unnamed protein product, partial [Rotaria magnacalcarata]